MKLLPYQKDFIEKLKDCDKLTPQYLLPMRFDAGKKNPWTLTVRDESGDVILVSDLAEAPTLPEPKDGTIVIDEMPRSCGKTHQRNVELLERLQNGEQLELLPDMWEQLAKYAATLPAIRIKSTPQPNPFFEALKEADTYSLADKLDGGNRAARRKRRK